MASTSKQTAVLNNLPPQPIDGPLSDQERQGLTIKQTQIVNFGRVTKLLGANFALADNNAVRDLFKLLADIDTQLEEINNTDFTGTAKRCGQRHWAKVWFEYWINREVSIEFDMFRPLITDKDMKNLPFFIQNPSSLFNKLSKTTNPVAKAFAAFDNNLVDMNLTTAHIINVDDEESIDVEATISTIDNNIESSLSQLADNTLNDSTLKKSSFAKAKQKADNYMNKIGAVLGVGKNGKDKAPAPADQPSATEAAPEMQDNMDDDMKENENPKEPNVRQFHEQHSTPGINRRPIGSKRSLPNDPIFRFSNRSNSERNINHLGGQDNPPHSKVRVTTPSFDGEFWKKMGSMLDVKNKELKDAFEGLETRVNNSLTSMRTDVDNNKVNVNLARTDINALKNTVEKVFPDRFDAIEKQVAAILKNDDDITIMQRELFYNLYRVKCNDYTIKVNDIVRDGVMLIDIASQAFLTYNETGRVKDVQKHKLQEALGFDIRIRHFKTRKEGKAATIIVTPADFVGNPKEKVKAVISTRKNFKGKFGLGYAQDPGTDFSQTWFTLRRAGIIRDFSTNMKGYTILILEDDTRVRVNEPEIFAGLDLEFLTTEKLKLLADEAVAFPWNGKIYTTPDFHKNRIATTREFFRTREEARERDAGAHQ